MLMFWRDHDFGEFLYNFLSLNFTLQNNYTALHNLHHPDHNLPGLMIKSDSSKTKHINHRK